MRNRFVTLVICLMAVLLFSSPAFAQFYPPSTQGNRAPGALAAAKAAPTPTMDPHDLSGIWWGRNKMGGTPPPMTAWGKEQFDAHKPSSGPRGVPPAFGNDPMGRCDPLGYPRNIWVNTRAFEFLPTQGKMVQTFEWTHASREIWTDGRKVPVEPDPRWYGWAASHWEGNVFVVESTGYDERAWLDDLGYPHSEEMRLTERWQRVDPVTLEVVMTIDDPKTYAKPWVGEKQTYKLQLPKDQTVLEEVYCVPSEEESFNEKVRNPAGLGTSKVPQQ